VTETLGRYELLKEIGRGSFAIVYRARDAELDRLVALKELKPVLLQDRDWVRRFRREAKAIARLDHPRIVPIYDVGEVGPRLFIIMRLIAGPSLEDLIRERGRLPWVEVVEIVSAIAEGLDYAHSQGILHRDLKPANILIDPDRGPMLADLGLAKLAGESSTSMTASGSVVGTPHYIAPEVWEGQGTTPQTDIYALGCILYEMVTGEKIFKGETSPAVMMAHFKPVGLPQQWPDGVPAGVTEILKTALANTPDQRYSTAGDMARALLALSQPQEFSRLAKDQPDTSRQATMGASEAKADSSPPEFSRLASDESFQIEMPDISPELAASWAEMEESSDMGLAKRDRLAKRWREFLAHLGPYIIVIGALGLINVLTDPGGYLWFLWPAMGWGVGLAFHLFSILTDEIKDRTGKWHSFVEHAGSYLIIMGLLVTIYLMTNPGGYPWFLWPAGAWGAAVAIHLWTTILEEDKSKPKARARRRAEREARKASRQKVETQQPERVNPAVQAHLDRARTYKAQIEALTQSTSDQIVYSRLQELNQQVDEWIQAVEALAKRINSFQRDAVIQHDLEAVPQSIAKLEAQLARETDPATRAELERTLLNRKNQWAALQHLQNMMKRAEIKIESTLSALGTIYSQLLIGQSTNQVADYGRLSSDVDEEVRTLQDHLEALEEVKLGKA